MNCNTSSVETLDDLIASLSPHDWEWGPIGDNTAGYCNWAHGVARILGEPYDVIWQRYRDVVERRWRAEVAS